MTIILEKDMAFGKSSLDNCTFIKKTFLAWYQFIIRDKNLVPYQTKHDNKTHGFAKSKKRFQIRLKTFGAIRNNSRIGHIRYLGQATIFQKAKYAPDYLSKSDSALDYLSVTLRSLR